MFLPEMDAWENYTKYNSKIIVIPLQKDDQKNI